MDDPLITFDRDKRGGSTEVCAHVALGRDIFLELWSNETVGYREWELEDIDLAGAHLTIGGDRFLPADNKLRHAIDRAFHEWIVQEDTG